MSICVSIYHKQSPLFVFSSFPTCVYIVIHLPVLLLSLGVYIPQAAASLRLFLSHVIDPPFYLRLSDQSPVPCSILPAAKQYKLSAWPPCPSQALPNKTSTTWQYLYSPEPFIFLFVTSSFLSSLPPLTQLSDPGHASTHSCLVFSSS